MNRETGKGSVNWVLRALTAAVLTAAMANCATGEVITEDDDGASNSGGASSSDVGSGGGDGGGQQVGGEGGSGGEAALPCGIDCSAITTPSCKEAVCDEALGQCVVLDEADGSDCDDGLFCTVNDACVAGLCQGGGDNDCGLMADACQGIQCDESTANCTQFAEADGAVCVSANLCDVNTTCVAGACIGTPNDCFFAPVQSDCHVPVCNPSTGICQSFVGNDGGPCSDVMTPCTVDKFCDAGACIGGQPKDCSVASSDCNLGVCDMTGTCVPQPQPAGATCPSAADSCNDGICDAGGVCQAVPLTGLACPEATDACNQGLCDAVGVCVANPTVGVQCMAATDDCNQGICDATGVCAANAVNEAGACDDGSNCTSGTICTAGSCGGGMSNVVVYFTEDFSSNAAGWTLGAEWAIGPAVSSPDPGACGNGDPGVDHSTTADNGLAGVVIGGTAVTTIHPMQYLTSPVIDTSMVIGPMELGYHRWLNSDYTPYMKNQVEVYDGTGWVVVWQTGSSPGVQDAAWTFNSHDIAAYKNANMQIRFGFEIGSSGVFTCPQWNVDDILIASGACP